MKNSPTMGRQLVPDANKVSKQQMQSRIVALIPLVLFLPLLLLGLSSRPPLADYNPSEKSERAAVVQLLRGDLQRAAEHAAYWRTVARRSGGKDAGAALRARNFSKNVAWLNKRLATRHPWVIGDPKARVLGASAVLPPLSGSPSRTAVRAR